jgi:hypothetical protein
MWDLKPFSIYILCLQEKIMFFNVGQKTFWYILLNFIIYNIYSLYSQNFFLIFSYEILKF